MFKLLARSIHVGLVVVLVGSLAAVAGAFEPSKPEVDRVFNEKKEALIIRTSALSPEEAFDRLKGVEFLGEDEFTAKAVYQSFRNRKNDGIDLSLRLLALPRVEIVNGQEVNRINDYYVAKKIFEVFPQESAPRLLKLYASGDATTRGNIIRASGNVAGPEIGALLVNALNDKTYAEAENSEVDGVPMRICDLAYNQLVPRHKVKNVLRAIGPNLRLENRDYHISMLKGRL